jgi:Ca2+-binding EF-hand superfamily protein
VTGFLPAPFVAFAALFFCASAAPAQTFPPSRFDADLDPFAAVEEKAVQKVVERQSRSQDTDRGRWLMELNRVYPGRCAAGRTRSDFDQWFLLLSDGQPEWRKDATQNRAVRDLFDRVTQKLELGPVPSLRKEEFLQFATAVLRPDRNGSIRIQEQYAEADRMFRVLDRDGNGTIEESEQTARMKAVVKEELAGPSGFNQDRYRIYFQGRVATGVELVTLPVRAAAAPKSDGGKRPGKSPKRPAGLPPWFDPLDTDSDGQIGLVEWRVDLLPLDLFQAVDFNADGLMTASEYLRYVKQAGDKLPAEFKISAAKK